MELVAFAKAADVAPSVRELLPSTDEELDKALRAASRVIRDLCGWHVAPPVRETVMVDAVSDLVMLPSMYVTEVHGVRLGGRDAAWSDERQSGRVEVPGAAGREVRLEITHGYAEVPESLHRLALLMAIRAEVSRTGVTREQLGAHSASFSLTGSQSAGSMVALETEQATLDPYRRSYTP